jgi:Uma2 family endonuclease
MAIPKERSGRRFTYGDYCTWPDEERWELIRGEAYAMSPAPNRRHQKLSGAILYQMYSYFEGKSCEVYHAPFDVRFPDFPAQEDDDIDTVVQPDIVVVCDRSKLDDRGCRGAPDLVVEILSPSTAAKDLREKLDLYESRGVKEYWVLHPAEKLVTVFVLDDALSYGKPSVHAGEESVKSRTFEGLEVDLKKVFAEK